MRERSSFVGSVSGGLAGRGCERKGPGRKAGEDRHEVSYPPEANHHKASSAAILLTSILALSQLISIFIDD